MLGPIIIVGFGMLLLLVISSGLTVVMSSLVPSHSRKDELDGIADEDGWTDNDNGVNLKSLGLGLALIIIPVGIIAAYWYVNEMSSQSIGNNAASRTACRSYIRAIEEFRKTNSRFPKTINELSAYFDNVLINAAHTTDQQPAQAYKDHYFCFYYQKHPTTGEIINIGIYAYPVKYNRWYDKVYYQTIGSLMYGADIHNLYPEIRYGSPVPLFNAFVYEKDLPSAFIE
ncbi:MAG: hypothetical protein ABIH86_05165 [Planctomycetota bacterium]